MRRLGYVLTWQLPRRVEEIRMNDLTTDRLLRGFQLGLPDEEHAHRHLACRLLHYGATPEDAASAVFHADFQHRLERAMEIACEVAADGHRAVA